MKWILIETNNANYEKWIGRSGESEITIELFENASSISFSNTKGTALVDDELVQDAKRKINEILNDRAKDI